MSEPARVYYARPPVVVKLVRASEPKAALHEFRAEVRSPLELLPKSVALEVNGKARLAEASLAAGAEKGTWEVRLKGVALEEGRNEVRLRLANAEGECREPGAAAVDYEPVKPVPVVEFLSPADSKSVTEPLLKAGASASARRAASSRPACSATPTRRWISTRRRQKADGTGGFELTAERDLRLALRDNALRLEARTPAASPTAPGGQLPAVAGRGPHRRPHRVAGATASRSRRPSRPTARRSSARCGASGSRARCCGTRRTTSGSARRRSCACWSTASSTCPPSYRLPPGVAARAPSRPTCCSTRPARTASSWACPPWKPTPPASRRSTSTAPPRCAPNGCI